MTKMQTVELARCFRSDPGRDNLFVELEGIWGRTSWAWGNIIYDDDLERYVLTVYTAHREGSSHRSRRAAADTASVWSWTKPWMEFDLFEIQSALSTAQNELANCLSAKRHSGWAPITERNYADTVTHEKRSLSMIRIVVCDISSKALGMADVRTQHSLTHSLKRWARGTPQNLCVELQDDTGWGWANIIWDDDREKYAFTVYTGHGNSWMTFDLSEVQNALSRAVSGLVERKFPEMDSRGRAPIRMRNYGDTHHHCGDWTLGVQLRDDSLHVSGVGDTKTAQCTSHRLSLWVKGVPPTALVTFEGVVLKSVKDGSTIVVVLEPADWSGDVFRSSVSGLDVPYHDLYCLSARVRAETELGVEERSVTNIVLIRSYSVEGYLYDASWRPGDPER